MSQQVDSEKSVGRELDRLSRAAREIEQVQRTTGLQRRRRIGEVIIRDVFAGSRLAWRARASTQHMSFRQLSRLLAGKVSKSELHRSVSVYLLCQDLPHVQYSDFLTVSHLDAVEGLPRRDQAELLELARARRWTVRELARTKNQRRNERRRADGASRTGRPPQSRSEQLISSGGRIATLLRRMRLEVQAAAADGTLSPAERTERLRACLGDMRAEFRQLDGLLDAASSEPPDALATGRSKPDFAARSGDRSSSEMSRLSHTG